MIKDDLSRDGDGVTWEWRTGRSERAEADGRGVRGRARGTSRVRRVPGGQGKQVAAGDRDDGTEGKGEPLRRRRRQLGNSRGACGVADIAGATGARVRVSGHCKRGEGVGQGRGSGSGEDTGGGPNLLRLGRPFK